MEQVAKMKAELDRLQSKMEERAHQRRNRRFKTEPSLFSPCSGSGSPGALMDDEDPARPVIIFDWDDTLLPTWYITEVIGASTKDDRCLSEESPFYEPMAEHGRLISETLRLASSFASVAIVTLAARPWVDNSSMRFLPGMDIQDVLDSYEIPVYYAREFVRKADKRAARVEEGVDLYMIAKRNAMKECLHKLSRCATRSGNVICIGDSATEEEAIKDIMWQDDAGMALCKTIKLLEDPTLEVLGMELQLVQTWLEKMVPFGNDFHISLNDTGSKLLWE